MRHVDVVQVPPVCDQVQLAAVQRLPLLHPVVLGDAARRRQDEPPAAIPDVFHRPRRRHLTSSHASYRLPGQHHSTRRRHLHRPYLLGE